MGNSPKLPNKLRVPSGYLIPRVVDQLSFCYIQRARISQDATGVMASIETKEGTRRAQIPAAAVAALLIGPGVEITSAAVSTLSRHGTTIVFVGEQGVRCYSSITAESASTELMHLAARAVVDDERRTKVARRMYAMRFGKAVPDGASIAELRGFEGARMRATYQALAKRHRIAFRREYTRGDFGAADPVNQALSSANACLYGITAAVLAALGIPKGLGVIHTGSQDSLVYDIADLYKADLTIPLAFRLADSEKPSSDARRELRDNLTTIRLIPRMVEDIRYAFGAVTHQAEKALDGGEVVSLWGEDGIVAGGTNHATAVPGTLPEDPAGVDTW